MELLHHDGSFKARLTVPMLEREAAQATSTTGESTEPSRRVNAVPGGTYHWYLCDDTMLMGSRSEELVYACMIHGGARSAPATVGHGTPTSHDFQGGQKLTEFTHHQLNLF